MSWLELLLILLCIIVWPAIPFFFWRAEINGWFANRFRKHNSMPPPENMPPETITPEDLFRRPPPKKTQD
ncbi:hypothetical protein LOC54_04190 [Acetobacter sp. AN02]|uniref:hypothetical protein n=1 Tax=Acetobacter sp. AN02 TaxID=2894186 RepID=UPI002434589F|nr:hypothetical protein [Acetobacter sp. AN02]MDG6094316.1 hypothetical protein [Acetobacter sp. AN02]